MKKNLDIFFKLLFTFIIIFLITANSYLQDKIPNLNTQNNFLNINFGHFMLSKNSQWWTDQSNRTNIDIHKYNNYSNYSAK